MNFVDVSGNTNLSEVDLVYAHVLFESAFDDLI